MDNSEFEIRAMTNPDDQGQDFIDALKEDPSRQQLLDDARAFDQRLQNSMNSITGPAALADRLKTNTQDAAEPESRSNNVVALNKPWLPFRGFALAASLVLALGVTYSLLSGSSEPSAAELAFGQQVMDHVYMEIDQVDSQEDVSYQVVSQVVGSVGGQMRNRDSMDNLGVSFAKPCVIIPENQSAHLALAGNQGAVNVIVVNNSPVKAEFTISDERFDGVVIPFDGGNLILVAEKQESLANYRELLTDNVDWVI